MLASVPMWKNQKRGFRSRVELRQSAQIRYYACLEAGALQHIQNVVRLPTRCDTIRGSDVAGSRQCMRDVFRDEINPGHGGGEHERPDADNRRTGNRQMSRNCLVERRGDKSPYFSMKLQNSVRRNKAISASGGADESYFI